MQPCRTPQGQRLRRNLLAFVKHIMLYRAVDLDQLLRRDFKNTTLSSSHVAYNPACVAWLHTCHDRDLQPFQLAVELRDVRMVR